MEEAGAGRLGLWERHWVVVLSAQPHTQDGVGWGCKVALSCAFQTPTPGTGMNPRSPPRLTLDLLLDPLLQSSATPLHICFYPLPLAWPERTKGHQRSVGQPRSDEGGGSCGPIRSHLSPAPTL